MADNIDEVMNYFIIFYAAWRAYGDEKIYEAVKKSIVSRGFDATIRSVQVDVLIRICIRLNLSVEGDNPFAVLLDIRKLFYGLDDYYVRERNKLQYQHNEFDYNKANSDYKDER